MIFHYLNRIDKRNFHMNSLFISLLRLIQQKPFDNDDLLYCRDPKEENRMIKVFHFPLQRNATDDQECGMGSLN
jgi:hypothetical protein